MAIRMVKIALLAALLQCTALGFMFGDRFKPRIASLTGGFTVQSNGAERYPYMASILKSDSHHCTGVLIKNNVVLTAAHCVDPRATNPSQLKIGFFRRSREETINVSQIKLHPAYRGRGGGSNLALLKMDSSPSQAIGIQFLALGSWEPYLNQRFMFLGWGRTSDSSRFSPQLQKIDLPILEQGACSVRMKREVRSSEFCAGAEGKGLCRGDDGGPLVQHGFDAKSDVLVGIATSQLFCGAPETPDLFTRISNYGSWLSSELKKL